MMWNASSHFWDAQGCYDRDKLSRKFSLRRGVPADSNAGQGLLCPHVLGFHLSTKRAQFPDDVDLAQLHLYPACLSRIPHELWFKSACMLLGDVNPLGSCMHAFLNSLEAI